MTRQTTPPPTVRLAYGDRSQERAAMTGGRLPGLLVSFAYLPQFQRNNHRYKYRDWVMDSGAFSFANSGRVIDLADYIEACKTVLAQDPTLTEVFALDVIGNPTASAANCAAMWAAGLEVIPCFHYGEPEDALLEMAEKYPKIAIGGVAYKRGRKKIAWAEQVFARVWPKKIHGFAFGSEDAVLALPFHSVDASTWEISPCGFGNWKQFGHMTVRGSSQDLRGEVDYFLDLEDRARLKWAKEMAVLDEHDANAPSVRLAVVKALGRGELMVT